MTITVGDIYTKFPTFKREDMIQLMNGRTDFNGRSTVSLANIASYKGEYAKKLSVFTAEKEGKSFTAGLSKDKQQAVSEAGVVSVNNDNASQNVNQNKAIPMDTSIFDINSQKKKQSA